MQNSETNPTTAETAKSKDAPIAVESRSRVEAEASSSGTSQVRFRELLESIDLTASKVDPSKQPTNQSKSAIVKTEPKTPTNPLPSNKYFLRESSSKENENVANTDDLDDEDKEDLMLKLSAYKQLPDGGYSCEFCSIKDARTVADQKPHIVRHLLRAHTYCYPYECSNCSNTFKRENVLKNHNDMVHYDSEGTNYFECARCEHKSKDENLLRLHTLRKHASVYRYVCKCCAKCFRTWMGKNEHEKAMMRKKPQRRYVCDKCDFLGRSKLELGKHFKTVHLQDMYKNRARNLFDCKRCNKLFLSRKSLRNHQPSHDIPVEDETTGFTCRDCGKKLSSKDHLKKHARVHSGERPYSCLECGRAFALRTTMRIHALSHRGIKPYTCDMCGLSYSQRSALMIHWKSKHKHLPPPPPIEIHQYFDEEGRILVPCEKDNARWYRKKSIISRIRVRTASELTDTNSLLIEQKSPVKDMPKKSKPISKRKCLLPPRIDFDEQEPSIAESSPESAKHDSAPDPIKIIEKNPLEIKKEPKQPLMYKKLKDGNFGCKMCHQKFSHRHQVRQHIKMRHVPREIFKCPDCNKTFKSKYQCNAHANQHRENSSDYLFCCDKCDYRGKSKHYLKTHEIRKHTTEYPFECDHCAKRFKMKMDLKFHLGTHSTSQHMCDACGRMYTSQDSLQKHRRVVHLNDYKFQCQVCHQKLLTQENYNSHMESHKNLHSCDECDLKFTKKYYVTRHKKRVHKVEKTNLCPVCGKAFVCMATLRVHYLTHAKVKPYMCNVCGFSFTQRSSMMLHWKRKHPDAGDPPPPVILTNFFDAIQSEVNKLVETTTEFPSNESRQSGTTTNRV